MYRTKLNGHANFIKHPHLLGKTFLRRKSKAKKAVIMPLLLSKYKTIKHKRLLTAEIAIGLGLGLASAAYMIFRFKK